MTAPKDKESEPLAPGEDAPEPRRMSPFQRLIYDTVVAQGLDYSEVARRGGTDPSTGKPRLTRQRVQQFVRTPIRRPPSPAKIKGLAVALRLSEDTIREHVSESLGLRTLRVGPAAELNELLDMVERLPVPEQERWARLSRFLARDLADFPTVDRNATGNVILIDREQAGDLTVALAQVAGDNAVSPEVREQARQFAETVFAEETGT